MANEVRVRSTYKPGAEKGLDKLKRQFTDLQKQGAKGFGLGIGAAVGLKAMNVLGGAVDTAAFKVVEFVGDSLREADRLGDAITRLTGQLGGPLAKSLENTAKGLERVGLSKQDVLELEATFADFATKAGVADQTIGDTARSVSELAGAMSLVTDMDTATIVEMIGKAADGSDRPLRDLGINLSDAAVQSRALHDSGKDNPKLLTDTELAAARLALILEDLNARFGETARGEQDLEGKTREMQARIETLQGEIGQALEGPFLQLLEWVDDLLTGLNIVTKAWGVLARDLSQFVSRVKSAFGPLQELLRLMGLIDKKTKTGHVFGSGGGGGSAAYHFGMAAGGPVRANEPHLVGEQGPELFVPDSAGTIIPRGSPARAVGMGTGSAVINVTYAPMYGFGSTTEMQRAAQALVPELTREMQRQGLLARRY